MVTRQAGAACNRFEISRFTAVEDKLEFHIGLLATAQPSDSVERLMGSPQSVWGWSCLFSILGKWVVYRKLHRFLYYILTFTKNVVLVVLIRNLFCNFYSKWGCNHYCYWSRDIYYDIHLNFYLGIYITYQLLPWTLFTWSSI